VPTVPSTSQNTCAAFALVPKATTPTSKILEKSHASLKKQVANQRFEGMTWVDVR